MKTPTDNVSLGAGATVALLNSGAPIQYVDLWTVNLSGGGVLNWSGGDVPITFNGTTYSLGPAIDRGTISNKIGTEVSTLDMTIDAAGSDTVNGVPLLAFVQGLGLDGATVKLQQGYLASWAAPVTVTGTTVEFYGRVTSVKGLSRSQVQVVISSWTVLFNRNYGPDLWQPPCLNTFCDANCTLSAATYTASGTVTSAMTPTSTSFSTNLTAANGYYTKGQIVFTSGANAGVRRTIQSYTLTNGVLTFPHQLLDPPSVGDTFEVIAGCDLSMSTCKTKFSNLQHFRGQPFIPVPETAL